jgi:hypothetical protein
MEREERYYIIKKSDLKAALDAKRLTQTDFQDLQETLARLRTQRFVDDKQPLKAVVVEADWPEYERVWKMIEARVNMENQHDAVRHSENHISLSEGVLLFARMLVEAAIQDEHEEGYDLTAGLFGPHLSKLMVQVNEWRKKAELFDMLTELMGYVQNGTDGIITLSQDDATLTHWVSHRTAGKTNYDWQEYGPSLQAAIKLAHEKHGGE